MKTGLKKFLTKRNLMLKFFQKCSCKIGDQRMWTPLMMEMLFYHKKAHFIFEQLPWFQVCWNNWLFLQLPLIILTLANYQDIMVAPTSLIVIITCFYHLSHYSSTTWQWIFGSSFSSLYIFSLCLILHQTLKITTFHYSYCL